MTNTMTNGLTMQQIGPIIGTIALIILFVFILGLFTGWWKKKKCEKCGGEVKTLRQKKALDYNATISKKVCANCGAEY